MIKTQEQKEKKKEYDKKYRIEHQEERKKYTKKYYKSHPDKAKKNREYYLSHREEHIARVMKYARTHDKERKEYGKKYSAEHREKINAYAKAWNAKRRLDVIGHYGGKCAFCGDKNSNHLAIDHINNDGAEHRRSIGRKLIYTWLQKNNYPNGFQVLCHTHNQEKCFYGTMTPVEFE